MNEYSKLVFPVENPYHADEASKIFWKCLYTSSTQEMLHYWVILPQNVQPVELNSVNFPDLNLINIGRYITQDASPYMEVWLAYERCQWEINASDWLYKKLSMMGEHIIHQRVVGNAAETGRFADVLTVRTYASGDEVISRYTVQKDYNTQKGGGNYFILKASCASRDYDSLNEKMYFTAVNWDLLKRSHLHLAELLNSVSFGKGGDFKIPASWQIKGIAENRFIVEHTIDGVNSGVINLFFYLTSECASPDEVYDSSVARFSQHNNGVVLHANEIEPINNDINPQLAETLFTCTGELLSADENMRAFYQMYLFNHKGVWCYIELVGRHRNKSDYCFEANKRCLEMILSTINLP